MIAQDIVPPSTAFAFAPLPPLRASFLCGNQHQPWIRILPSHAQLTHLPKLNFAPRPAHPDHSPQTSTTNRGTRTTRVCPILISVKCDQPANPKTYVCRSPKSAETALISLSRRSRRSPLDEEEPPPPPPIVGERSDSSNWSSRRVGVSGSVQLVIVKLAECRLMADVMSRLLTGGSGVDGMSSTTIISGTSIVSARLRKL